MERVTSRAGEILLFLFSVVVKNELHVHLGVLTFAKLIGRGCQMCTSSFHAVKRYLQPYGARHKALLRFCRYAEPCRLYFV